MAYQDPLPEPCGGADEQALTDIHGPPPSAPPSVRRRRNRSARIGAVTVPVPIDNYPEGLEKLREKERETSDNTPLGERMKQYEAPTRGFLPRRTYTIVRVDIRAAHSFLRYCERPYDAVFADDMNHVAEALCREITGSRLAYAQSDEISVLYTDFENHNTEPWFGGVVAKQASIAASLATAVLNSFQKPPRGNLPHFDGRVFTINDPVEVANYFIWRQRDATRNSISMAAQAEFPHARLQGLNGDEMQELLFQEKDIIWDDYPGEFRRGRVVYREDRGIAGTSWWATAAPVFAAEPGSWLAERIPELPSMKGEAPQRAFLC